MCILIERPAQWRHRAACAGTKPIVALAYTLNIHNNSHTQTLLIFSLGSLTRPPFTIVNVVKVASHELYSVTAIYLNTYSLARFLTCIQNGKMRRCVI